LNTQNISDNRKQSQSRKTVALSNKCAFWCTVVHRSDDLLTKYKYTVSQKNDTDVAHYNFDEVQPILKNEMTTREIIFVHWVNNTTLLSTKKLLEFVDECWRYSKPKQCNCRDTVYSMTEKNLILGIMFMFLQVVQRH